MAVIAGAAQEPVDLSGSRDVCLYRRVRAGNRYELRADDERDHGGGGNAEFGHGPRGGIPYANRRTARVGSRRSASCTC